MAWCKLAWKFVIRSANVKTFSVEETAGICARHGIVVQQYGGRPRNRMTLKAKSLISGVMAALSAFVVKGVQ